MGFRFSKTVKIVPGLKFRVNAKSVSMSVGGRRARYTVNSRGRRTASVSLPGGLWFGHTTASRRKKRRTSHPKPVRQASAAPRQYAPVPAPPQYFPVPTFLRYAPTPTPMMTLQAMLSGAYWPQRELRMAIDGYRRGVPARDAALRCLGVAGSHQSVFVAGHAIAGLIALPVDTELAAWAFSKVFGTGAEVAADTFFRRHTPIFLMRVPLGTTTQPREAVLPVSRDTIGISLVRMYAAIGRYGEAVAVGAGIADPNLATSARLFLETEPALARFRPGTPPPSPLKPGR